METSLNTNDVEFEKHEEQDLENGPTYPPNNNLAGIQVETPKTRKNNEFDTPQTLHATSPHSENVIVFIASTGFVTDQVEDQFGVGTEVSILGQIMFILGVAIGPMFLAPLSEIYCRQPIFVISIFMFSILQIPTALSLTFADLVVSRFLTGCFAGLPISNMGASAADLFPTVGRLGRLFLSGSSTNFGWPTIGGAIYVTTGSLKWLYWTLLIFGYQGERRIKWEYLSGELFRAFRHLLSEPIVFALALTTTYLFGLIFIFLQGYPFVYSDEYGFNSLQGGAVFLVSIGGGLATLATQPVQNWMYRRSARSTMGEKLRPEARLYIAYFTVWMLPVSIFWFAFTPTHPEISYQVPMRSGFLFGYAEVAVYTGIWQYVTDSYGEHAGSALAACNLPANGISAGSAHASITMFENEGTKWALATLGFISLGFLAVPLLLIWKRLELRSRFALSNSAGAMDE